MKRLLSISAALFAGVVALVLTTDLAPARRSDSDGFVAKSMSISVHDNYFQPPILQVMPGDTVRWVNNGRHAHTVTTQDGSDYSLAPRTSMALTFYSPGTLRYYCRFHRLHRMEGEIIVAGTRNESSGIPGFEATEISRAQPGRTCCEESRRTEDDVNTLP